MRRWLAIVVVTPWAVWAIARTAGLDRAHPFIAFAAFTPYAAATAPFALLVALVLRRRIAALIALVTVVLFAVAVVPRALDRQGPGGESNAGLTVMTLNTYAGGADASQIMDLVRRYDVDVLALEELSSEALDRIDREGGDELFAGRAEEPRAGGVGNALLSRAPLERVPDAEGWSLPHEPAADVRLGGGRGTVRFRVVHPRPPVGREATGQWRTYLDGLPAPRDGRRAVMLGDFNATLDHRSFRRLLDRGWNDAGDTKGRGLQPTWPVGRRILGLTIDHVLSSRDYAVRRYSLHEIRGTDHRAVIATLARR